MPLHGEASAKYGNRFEAKWTVRCIARLLTGDADSIRLVPPGEEGEGCEFWLKRGIITEYHQVKRQRAYSNAWSVADLFREDVLTNAFKKTDDLNAEFIFFSGISCGELDELSDAARKAASFSEFRAEFLRGSRVKTWKALVEGWGPLICARLVLPLTVEEEERDHACQNLAYDRLRRIHFLNEHEVLLDETLEALLRPVTYSDPARVRNDLFAFVFDRVHDVIYPDSIWAYLGNLGHVPSDYGRNTSVLLAVQVLNSRFGSLVGAIGPGVVIPREETDLAFAILLGSGGTKNSALISGEAGAGKTGVLGQVIQKIKDATVPHIYVRVDTLYPADNPRLLASQLGLPASPVDVLAGIAKGRPCVLVIDQLDAVSMVSGRNPGFFVCIHEMIRETRAHSNMRLLMACRQFDLEKDNRLRELVSDRGPAREIVVKPLSFDAVKTVLHKLGCLPSQYTECQLELLRLPLNLSLFAESLDKHSQAPLSFASSIDLFRAYWENKRNAVRARLGEHPDQWADVFDRLCGRITERQALFVPEEEVLDDYERTVRAMESENVLVLDGNRVGFFHEGFFDYVFARRFATKGRDLIQYLKDGEQDLFKRAPMRQILLHAQTSDHTHFVTELRRVVLDPSIRFHLRKCALEVTTKIDHASDELWQLFKDAIATAEPALVREIWRVLCTTPAWFTFLHAKGLMREWLASQDPEQRQRVLAMVRNHIRSFPVVCAELLTPYVGTSEKWNADIFDIIWLRVLSLDRSVFNLFLRMIDGGAVAQLGNQNFWMSIYEIPKSHPEWAAEALGLYLRMVLTKLDLKNVQWHFLPRDGSGEHVVIEIAEKAPAAFLEAVLPIFLHIVTGTAKERDQRLKIDHVWSARMYREDSLSIEDSILRGIEDAFRKLAGASIQEFMKFIELLLPYGDYDSVNFVIVRAFTAAPPQLADRTIEYLLKNLQRLECGWAGAGGGDFTYWAAREVIEHVSVHCSDVSFVRLEQVFIQYYPRWERSKDGYTQRGHWQLVMLPALDSNRRSPQVVARIGEWQRKFPKMRIEPPIASKVRCVGSPIPDKAIVKMTDAQWLRALSKYDTDDGSRRDPKRFLMGGAHQLSGLLESETKRDPMRFANLSEQLPADTHPYYFHALLRGLKDSSATKETVFDVVRRIHSLPTKPGHRYLCDAITKFSGEDIPEDILDIVGWDATESDDPQTDEISIHREKATEDDRPHDILTTAINSVRGAAAEAVGTLIFDKAERISFFLPHLERMVHEPTVVVRSTIAAALLGLYKHDQQKAVDLFLVLVNTDKDVLFATHHVGRFLYHANIKHFARLQPILRRMLDSQMACVREAGARHVCLAQFSNPDARSMVEECLVGDDAKRKGAVQIAEANLFNQACSAFSHATLPAFFNDPVKEIRDEAASCFRNAKGRELDTCKPVLRAFLKSKAFAENVEDLTWPMEHSTADLAEEVLLTCEAVIRVMGDTDNILKHRLYGQTNMIAELVLRAYRQTSNAVLRSRCLDLVDSLLSQEVYEISKELEEFER